MQTALADFIKNTAQGKEADRILRACVHCGFCTATCPTYQLLGDELDGPRGRIYLIKQALEGHDVSDKTQLHLDRCLTCRSCETTCPSGVEYGKLLDIGRAVVDSKIGRSRIAQVKRWALRYFLSRRFLFTPALRLGQRLRFLLPQSLKAKVPARQLFGAWPQARHVRKMLILDGCVQPAYKPDTNGATARVLDRLGISVIRVQNESCCGAISFHLDAQDEAKDLMRRNIDACWGHIEQGIEAIISTASGCGVMLKDYAYLLRDDPLYKDKAARMSTLTKDLSEVIAAEDLSQLGTTLNTEAKIAYHPPCTLQHGQKLNGKVESILQQLGFQLTAVADAHLCCGSAGTYSVLQSKIAQQLLHNKMAALQAQTPDLIATANIGCQLHLESATQRPVKHWIELLDVA